LRPGEKLFEELLISDDVSKTDNPLIMRAKEEMLAWSEIESNLENLRFAIKENNSSKIREILIKVVPLFTPQCEVMDLLHHA